MKIVSTVLYLILLIAGFYLGTRISNAFLAAVKAEDQRRGMKIYVFRYLSFFILFLQFWLLTRMFPVLLILILIGASTLGSIIYILLGAIAGFTLEQNKQKIAVLSLIGGVTRNPAASCLWVIGLLLFQTISAIGALWVFWKYPIGDSRARVLIAMFLFVLPLLIRIPMSLFLAWPVVTSEYVDNDLRNSHLAEAFANIIYQTILLMFPFWLFKQDIAQFNVPLPPFWVLLSIPLFAFILCNLLPFFLGLYRHRAQSRALLDWRSNWLKETLITNEMPQGEQRNASFQERLQELDAEIRTRFAKNDLFHYYQKMVWARNSGDNGTEPILPGADELQIIDGTEPLPIVENELPKPIESVPSPSSQSMAAAPKQADVRNALRMAKAYLKGNRPMRANAEANISEKVLSIMEQNQSNLVKWDIRFNHLQKLIQMYEVTLDAGTQDIGKYAKARLDEIKESVKANTAKNILAGGILSGSSTIIILLLKHYEAGIYALIDKLVR